MKYFLLIFAIVLLHSCNEREELSSTFYYEILSKDDVIKGYFKITTNNFKNRRVDSIYRYDKEKKLQNTHVEEFIISSNMVKSTNQETLLIFTKKDSCYNYVDLSNKSYKTCYLGKTKLDLDKITYDNSYKFSMKELEIDGISSYKYYDNNFVLLRHEYEDGFLDYFRIDRVEKINGIE